MTLADMITQAMEMAPQDPSGRLQYDWLFWRKAINRHYRDILGKARWSFLTKDAVAATVAAVSAGTISTTAGSPTVTGTGTSWTSAQVGMYLQTASFPLIKITAVGSGTSLTLETNYPTDQTTVTYNIVQPYLGLATDFWRPLVFNVQWLLLGPYARKSFDLVDPYRTTVTTPRAFSYAGATQGTTASLPVQQIELWPVPDKVYICRYQYIQKATDLVAGTDVPLLPRSDILVWGAITDAYANFAAQMGQPNILDSAKPFKSMYDDAFEAMLEYDIPLQNRPNVQQQNNMPFIISDDILYKLGQPLPLGFAG